MLEASRQAYGVGGMFIASLVIVLFMWLYFKVFR